MLNILNQILTICMCLIGWSTHDCQINNFTEVDGEHSSRTTESTENDTRPEGLKAAVYETNFYQPGYFGLILVKIKHALCQC